MLMLRRNRWFLGAGLAVAIALSLALPPTVTAQQVYIQPESSALEVYEQLPDFPKANTYVRRESGRVDEENTLLSRLIAYHIYVKNRSPFFRFDWKLTLADYLGAHEPLSPTLYPSGTTLAENPLVGDRDLIRNLNRRQREELIEALVATFNTRRQAPRPAPDRPTSAPPTPAPETRPRQPRLPEPGAADLLR